MREMTTEVPASMRVQNRAETPTFEFSGIQELTAEDSAESAVRKAANNVYTNSTRLLRIDDVNALAESLRGPGGSFDSEKFEVIAGEIDQMVAEGYLAPESGAAFKRQILGHSAQQLDDVQADGYDAEAIERFRFRADDREDRIGVRAEMREAIEDGRLTDDEMARVFETAIGQAGKVTVHDLRAMRQQIRRASERGELSQDQASSLFDRLDRLIVRDLGDSEQLHESATTYILEVIEKRDRGDAPSVTEVVAGVVNEDGSLKPGFRATLFAAMIDTDGSVQESEVRELGDALAKAVQDGALKPAAYDRAVRLINDRFEVLANGNRYLDTAIVGVGGRIPNEALTELLANSVADGNLTAEELDRAFALAGRDGTVHLDEVRAIWDARLSTLNGEERTDLLPFAEELIDIELRARTEQWGFSTEAYDHLMTLGREDFGALEVSDSALRDSLDLPPVVEGPAQPGIGSGVAKETRAAILLPSFDQLLEPQPERIPAEVDSGDRVSASQATESRQALGIEG
ncbi:MAG: hypothetical protein AAFZ38_12250 [Myxococcota bacterium]